MAEHVPHSSLARRIRQAALVAGLGVVTLIALAHTPWAENRVGHWALARMQRAGVLARVERLRYNLLTWQVRVEGVSLAASASPQDPFLEARAVELGHGIGVKYGEGFTARRWIGVKSLFDIF